MPEVNRFPLHALIDRHRYKGDGKEDSRLWVSDDGQS